MTTYLVTGSTGRLGSAALRPLVDLVGADPVVALVRGSASLPVRTVRADYDDPASLRRALDGVDRLLLVSSPVLDPVVRTRQHLAVVQAARDARLEHVVYTSARGAEHDPGHRATEEALAGLGHSILRNTLYSEPFVQAALGAGRVRSSAGEALLATASIADLGEAAARALVSPPPGDVLELRGPAWTFAELAAALEAPLDAVTDSETGPFAPLFPLLRRGVYAESGDDLARLLGRAPETIAQVAARVRGAGSR